MDDYWQQCIVGEDWLHWWYDWSTDTDWLTDTDLEIQEICDDKAQKETDTKQSNK